MNLEFSEDQKFVQQTARDFLAERAGLAGPQWLDEGLAQLFAHGSLENGELHTDRDAPSLVAARERFSNTSLSLLLAWEETHAGAVEGHVFPAGRPLSHALAVFCIEGDTGPLSERIRRFAAMQPEELEALEPALRAWMGAGMPAPAP